MIRVLSGLSLRDSEICGEKGKVSFVHVGVAVGQAHRQRQSITGCACSWILLGLYAILKCPVQTANKIPKVRLSISTAPPHRVMIGPHAARRLMDRIGVSSECSKSQCSRLVHSSSNTWADWYSATSRGGLIGKSKASCCHCLTIQFYTTVFFYPVLVNIHSCWSWGLKREKKLLWFCNFTLDPYIFESVVVGLSLFIRYWKSLKGRNEHGDTLIIGRGWRSSAVAI